MDSDSVNISTRTAFQTSHIFTFKILTVTNRPASIRLISCQCFDIGFEKIIHANVPYLNIFGKYQQIRNFQCQCRISRFSCDV